MKNTTVSHIMTIPVITIGPEASIEDALDLMTDSRIQRLPVVSSGLLAGIVTHGDLAAAKPSRGTTLSRAEILTALDETPVRDVMSTHVVTVGSRATVRHAAQLMLTRRISGLPVVDAGDLLGIVTESDIFRLLAQAAIGDQLAASQVGDWMTRDVVTTQPQTSALEAQALMTSNGVRRLPVMRGGSLVGILTFGDLRASRGSELPVLARFELTESLDTLKVENIMTTMVTTVSPTTPIREAARLMAALHIGGLPVMHAGGLMGIITESDLLRCVVEAVEDASELAEHHAS